MLEHTNETREKIKISYSTVTRVYSGKQLLYDFNKSKAVLHEEEEEKSVDFLLQQASCGFPLTHRLLEEVVNAIIRNRDPDFPGVGKGYTDRFLAQNAHRVSSYWGSPLEQCRAQAVNQHTIGAWFDLVEYLVAEHNVTSEDIWGADETGITLGHAAAERVLGATGKKGQHTSSNGSQENVSVMVTIGARGVSIPPFVIFKGQAFMVSWFLQPNTANAKISYSKKGYMTGEVGLEWIKHFNNYAPPSAPDRTRLLLVDGHVSHYTLELLNYAREHNIVLACYPSHTTHVLQGLDVACFARLKQLYSRYAKQRENTQGFKVTKSTFLVPFSKAYSETFTPETIRSAFSSTGIHPFNRNIVSAETMAPSLPTSTQSSLPLSLPDAVAAVARVWAIDPSLTDNNTGGMQLPGARLGDEFQQAPVPNPGHHANLSALVTNTSASFLADGVPVTVANSLTPLPFHHLPPLPSSTLAMNKAAISPEARLMAELEAYRAQEHTLQKMYEGAQAQLVLADRHCSLLQGRLAAKEDRAKEKTARTGHERLMGDGLPRALSHGEFYDVRVRRSQIAAAEEVEKERKAAKNAQIKGMKEEWKLAEAARKEQNNQVRLKWKEGPLAKWNAAHEQAKAEGRRLMGMPRPKPPPKLPPLPKPWLNPANNVTTETNTGVEDVSEAVEEYEDKNDESEQGSDTESDAESDEE
ncbi:hypothetical protein RSOLAG22IIIB_08826 [Rhizoctonia solani]|uniref:DDE-1 domain-containing protein n=1 Tax=Rhizoctonia solani TaxID=456999 RepID=A0A0K6FUW2_9AGAM|nr:hypothetical protein RSOLAG22IIIB_08826 [Rhizoctonia solani]